MNKPNYVPVEGCELCDHGYNSVPCGTCNGEGGRCSNFKCVNGEVPIACPCNPLPYVEQDY
jgi:hypothetical protein